MGRNSGFGSINLAAQAN